MYTCQKCQTPTTFPRFNSPRSLFSSRRGRCGEYANLFGAYCRAVGFDTRYCLDLTDHVWVEVWSVRMGKWIHADSCEGLIDRPNMYEQVCSCLSIICLKFCHHRLADLEVVFSKPTCTHLNYCNKTPHKLGLGKEAKLRHWGNSRFRHRHYKTIHAKVPHGRLSNTSTRTLA